MSDQKRWVRIQDMNEKLVGVSYELREGRELIVVSTLVGDGDDAVIVDTRRELVGPAMVSSRAPTSAERDELL